jgi:hypothetical protein
MRERIITHQSEQFSNGGSLSVVPLAKITTPEGSSVYTYRSPFRLFLKLYNAGGVQIPARSNILIAKKRPGEDFPTFIKKIPYQGYYDLTIAQQQDNAFASAVTHELPFDAIVNPEDHTLEFYVESPDTVDLNQANTRFVLSAWENN